MARRSLAPCLSALVLTAILSACQTTGTGGEQASRAGDTIRLSPQFRQKIASSILMEYIRIGAGPATISEVRTRQGLWGANTSFLIRYPAKNPSVFASPGATLMHCISVQMEPRISAGKEDGFRVHLKPNGIGCSAHDKTEPYVELNRMASRLQGCRAKGEEQCLLFTNMPEAEARKLMNRR